MLNTPQQYCNLFCAAWLLWWLCRAIKAIVKGNRHAVNFLILTHYLFCGLPAVLNLILGSPLYTHFTSFTLLQYDPVVDYIYTFYVCACPWIWWRFGRPSLATPALAGSPKKLEMGRARRYRVVLYAIATAPLWILPGAPDISFYSSYAAVIVSSMTPEMTAFQGYMSAATMFSVLAIAGLWLLSKRLGPTILLTSPLLVAAIWLNGKRYIVLMAMVILFLALFEKRVLTGGKLFCTALLCLTGFGAFSYSYQSGVRSKDIVAAAAQYEDFRIDYGRDHGIKYAIYCELHPQENAILEYRGQSLLFDLTAPVPRDLWPDKPWPYAVYATSAGLGISPQNLNWGITTSWLDETIANFSWLGLIVGPFTLAALCRIGSSSSSKLCQFLTIIVSCLMLAVQISAFSLLFAGWIVSIVLEHIRRTRRVKHTKGKGLPLYVPA
jgi:hypothetical protein